jgi:hypothetical protein
MTDVQLVRPWRVAVTGDKKKKEVTWSELATTLLTMTRKTGR